MRHKTLAITLSVSLLTGLASLEVVAGKGPGGSSGRSAGGGMPPMDMSRGGMSKGMPGMGGKGGSGGMPGMGGGGSQGKAVDSQSRDRHRVGEKEGVGVRTREADQAR